MDGAARSVDRASRRMDEKWRKLAALRKSLAAQPDAKSSASAAAAALLAQQQAHQAALDAFGSLRSSAGGDGFPVLL